MPSVATSGECTVLRLIKEFWQVAKGRYVTFGRVTGTHQNYKPVLKLLRRCCGHLKVTQFGPGLVRRDSKTSLQIETGDR